MESEGYNSLKAIVGDFKAGYLPKELDKHIVNVIQGYEQVAEGLSWKLRRGQKIVREYTVGAQIEQAPNWHSRIKLSNQKDEFGLNRVDLEWRLSEIDIHSMNTLAYLIGRFVGETGLGRLKRTLPSDPDAIHEILHGDWHHIGTTRMSATPATGVVDENCRVHSVKNLYMAGSSVFPTSGHAVPTFTIVAMAARLADHLKSKLGIS
jgi:choline dehydrogenase-like flavoprotein